jgi:hypothetical protein
MNNTTKNSNNKQSYQERKKARMGEYQSVIGIGIAAMLLMIVLRLIGV